MSTVRDAYARRSAEYAKLLGTMASVHPSDRQLVTSWADRIIGPALDAGCGPGHWTAYLASRGLDIRGVDLVPEFVAYARAEHPETRFDLGSLDTLDAETGTEGGVLAWYSLIHHRPDTIETPLAEFGRVLRPGGELLIGCFEGPSVESFDHAVVTAYRWPLMELAEQVRRAGFEVIETHTRTSLDQRPHGAILARRADTVR
ncbi:Ubiquinone/menaquinone biosynthesis C-methylase UbiE [Plantibacter flavus]|uniref:Ubiquinone/menaquinone biosynthesis C-methylase UbiE n=1 Tax=Plantibacter flavus TaxID=150123 RepID=A0A3N2BYX5_9MICO|nr:class I SAM-dependent methyltransferase [Plantibacter flavus]ROR80468.1 ubiquinone/menaquinone biosynthesis C-methylase UbiE [Plantibacter flavus]SMG34074.1 Ubiquinone/menaquinone biosynthesis C-methylase UbiE [Plantibacter flavus]